MSACEMRDSHLLYSTRLTMRMNSFPNETPEEFTLPFSRIPLCNAQHESVTQSRRRKRTNFTQEQISAMEAVFGSNRYPNIYVRERLGELISQPESRIHVWFQNRRAKLRRQVGGTGRPSPNPTCMVMHSNSPDQLHLSALHGHQCQFPDLSGSLTSDADLGPTPNQNRRREGIGINDHLTDPTHRGYPASNQISVNNNNVKVENPRPPAPQAAGDARRSVKPHVMVVLLEECDHFPLGPALRPQLDISIVPDAPSETAFSPGAGPSDCLEDVSRFSPISNIGDSRSDWEYSVASPDVFSASLINSQQF